MTHLTIVVLQTLRKKISNSVEGENYLIMALFYYTLLYIIRIWQATSNEKKQKFHFRFLCELLTSTHLLSGLMGS